MVGSKEIGAKLRVFGKKKFGSIQNLAERLNMTAGAFSTYTRGVSYPGGKMLAKLLDLGCDINWLLSKNNIADSSTLVKESEIPYGNRETIISKLETIKSNIIEIENLMA